MHPSRRTVLRAAVALALTGLFTGTFPLPARSAADLDSVLAASGKALGLGAAGRVTSLVERGAVNIAGVPGTGEQWIDIRNGAYAQYISAGPLSQDSGFDGRHAWTRDRSGVAWDDGSADVRYSNQDATLLNRYALWAPDRGGATVALEPAKTEGAATYDIISVTPPGGLAFDLWIDRATHLPARLIQPIGLTTTTTTYSDYRRVDGLNVPFEQHFSTPQGAFSIKVTAAAANPPEAEVRLARPTSSAHDFSIASGSSTTIPFELIENHVYLELKLNGKGPYRFIFDTGADFLLDTDVAKVLGIVGKGEIQGGGVGAATEGFSFAKVDRVAIGNATLRDQTFVLAPVRAGFGVGSGAPIDGLIGFGVLARFVTTFDYGRRRIVLALPDATAAPRVDGTTIPFTFHGTTPMIDCKIGSFSGSCMVDTGSRLSLSLTSPFERAHPSIVPADATAVGVNGFGVGGPASGRLGRATLEIGSLSFPNTITDFTSQQRGAFADPFIIGNIGGGIWKRFALTFDYARQKMTMVPNANGPTSDDYDRSGLFLIRNRSGVLVADARPGTPAAAAGIVRGEVLVSVDGRDASVMSLAAVRDLFMAKAGTAYKIVVKSKDGTTKIVTLTLRDYV